MLAISGKWYVNFRKSYIGKLKTIVQNVYRWMEQSTRNFQPFLSYRNCKAIFFLFQKMFYKIHWLGSHERIPLKAFQFVSIVYFTETEISSRKHRAGTTFVIRLKMTAAYQQLELDLNFSINILKNHTSLTELLTSSAFQK